VDSAVRWLWRATGRKKGYVPALTPIQGVSGGLGILYAVLLRNIVDSAMRHDGGVLWHIVVPIVELVVLQIALSAIVRWLRELATADVENRFKQRLTGNILQKKHRAVPSRSRSASTFGNTPVGTVAAVRLREPLERRKPQWRNMWKPSWK
jgi:ATP-binding cassette subfamily B protein